MYIKSMTGATLPCRTANRTANRVFPDCIPDKVRTVTLKQRRQYPHQGLHHLSYISSVTDLFGVNPSTIIYIFQEDLLTLRGELFVIKENIYFKVEDKTPVVNICSTYGRHLSVHNEHLGMDKTIIEIDFYVTLQ